MDSSINLSNLNSYLELLIGFTFAYAGFEGFKNYINGISARDFNSSHAQFKEKLNNQKSKFLVILNSGRYLDRKQKQFNDLEKRYKNISNEILNVYNGVSFQSMFYLTGLYYLVYLIVGAFQGVISYKVIYPFICILSLVLFGFQFIVINVLKKRVQDDRRIVDSKWLDTHRAIKYFLGLSVVIFIFFGLLIPGNIDDQKVNAIFGNNQICDWHWGPFTFIQLEWRVLVKVVILLMVIIIPLMPYRFYYLRDKKLIKPLTDKLKEISEELQGMINDLEDDYEMIISHRDTDAKKSKANTLDSDSEISS